MKTKQKVKPRTKLESTQREERNTVSYSISFDREVFEIMERERRKTRMETPRSAYIRESLELRFRREGLMK